jgi:oligopeptide transport system substrate-binding protein
MQMRISAFLLFLIFFSGCQTQHETGANSLKMSYADDPETLDPRQVRTLPTATLIHAFYEGLMRIDLAGQPTPAIAQSVTLSPDQKTYTFTLRRSLWSDGTPLTAYDFEETWKSFLHPAFAAPNAYQLYVIKGAKTAKEGRASLDQVGIKALDDLTLVVELEHPTPSFLGLTASYFYYPVSKQMRAGSFSKEQMEGPAFVSNGPFKLSRWARHNEIVAIKNPLYWDKESVQLDQISFVILEDHTALNMFINGDIDWTGSPLSTLPSDALATLKDKGILKVTLGSGTHLVRFNVKQPLLDQKKMRQALGLAINRQDIVQHVLQGNQTAATRFVPPSFGHSLSFYQDNNIQQAQALFEEVLNENNLTREKLPTLTLCYGASERTHKIAQVLQQQWKKALGLTVALQSCEAKTLFDRLKSQDYAMALGSWYADIRDPQSFLDVFKYRNNGTNNTQWENSAYIQLLDEGAVETNPEKRIAILNQSEALLLEEMPIVPLFHAAYNYVHKPQIKGVYFSDLGYLDFKQAYIDSPAH